MKQHLFFHVAFLVVIAGTLMYSGCSSEFNSPAQPQDSSLSSLASEEFNVSSAAKSERNFRAHLSGKNEVSEPVDTLAQGQVIFQLSKDGSELRYKLIVANIENVFMAHIHLAPSNANGPIVVWLYPAESFPLPPTPPIASLIPGRFDGILAEGTITATDLVGRLGGMTLTDLMNEINNGNTYVNVHTIAHPGGEIRGQIR